MKIHILVNIQNINDVKNDVFSIYFVQLKQCLIPICISIFRFSSIDGKQLSLFKNIDIAFFGVNLQMIHEKEITFFV